MKSKVTLLFVLAISLTISLGVEAHGNYARAVVESCSGCTLNRLPDVKRFIFDDVPQYDNVEFKHIQGAIPELVVYDKNDEEVERLTLSSLTRDECNELLVSKGFKRNNRSKDEI